ncbi:hypothetical protein A6R68_15252 [Neotoma lepida]|uniref:cardiolipin synthase (CMP-forming) n=1 Tax=Neotoma lepida TaxID=56216 RepID=A0A1A6H7B7_NEOLE|nr:hypothetical protein A6R68_15252 [Neotoma lepida]
MLAWRVARGAWGPLRVAVRPPGARLGRGGSRRALLPPAACCLGCLAERWRLRPAAFALRLPGAGPRNHCSGAGKAAPEPAAGGGATAQAPGARWVPASAASPYENPWTIPNMLSMTRIGLAPVLGYLILEEDFNVALGVFALAGLTDLLDGFIARNWANQKSALGSALDPLADKVLISILYVSLTYADLIPGKNTHRTLAKYFNPCYATARLKPTFISKVLYSLHYSCISIQLLSLWSKNCSSDKGQMRGIQLQQQGSDLHHRQQRQ